MNHQQTRLQGFITINPWGRHFFFPEACWIPMWTLLQSIFTFCHEKTTKIKTPQIVELSGPCSTTMLVYWRMNHTGDVWYSIEGSLWCITISINLDFRNKYGTTEEQKDADKFVRLQKRPIPKMRGIVFFAMCHQLPLRWGPSSRSMAHVLKNRGVSFWLLRTATLRRSWNMWKKIRIFVWDESKLHGAEIQVIVRCIIIYECTQICIWAATKIYRNGK